MTAPRIDIAAAPLAGTTLVEASAGTGKTWTIAALYVRLLLERRLTVEQILVLTFGVAATAELKSRLRARLAQVRELLERGDLAAMAASGDALVAHVGRTTADAHQAALLLALAVESFDQAPVFTLHGFCQRVLAEHAFESGAPFVAEVTPDESALIDEVAQDFWRRETAAASPAWVAWLVTRCKLSPVRLAADVRAFMLRPYAAVIGPEAASLEPFETFRAAHAEARAIWQTERAALLELLAPVFQARYVESRFRAMDACLASAIGLPPLGTPIVQFTPEKLKHKVSHPFLDCIARLCAAAEPAKAAAEHAFAALRVRLAHWARTELTERKRARALVGYGDLVANVATALDGPQGAALATTLRQRYPAALLDEFQDTDPPQSAIFERLYAGTDLPVYCVGDPKQAIYGFRGADVNAYLAARERADAQRTLGVNQRSVPAQVHAVNAIFSREHAFLDPSILFARSDPGQRELPTLVLREPLPAPFTLWFLGAEEGKPLTKTVANERVAIATAAAIAALLSPGAARLDDTPLGGQHIAVLVPSHRQGGLVRAALARHGIASVTYGQDNVYQTAEAEAVERVLVAVAEPGREGLVRAALATSLLGRDAAALAACDADASAWDAEQSRFVRYRERAVQHGFIRMWRELIEAEGVPARLLALPDGERRLTNLQHLSDLLQQAAVSEGLDVDALARLLARAREGRFGNPDAQLLRLESDAKLVRVLTVHAAKGLEFPIVFCPFLWDGARYAGRDGIAACHAGGAAVIDLGSPQFAAHVAATEREEQAEDLRLAYVALTRAQHCCVIAWGNVADAGAAPLAWLLHGVTDKKAIEQRGDAQVRADLDGVVASSNGAIGVIDFPAAVMAPAAPAGAQAVGPLAARRFDTVIRAPWRVSSFSGLVARRALETPDYDALPADALAAPMRAARAPGNRSLTAFPGGMRVGTLIHTLFERVDFAQPDSALAHALVGETLAAFDVEATWAPALRAMLTDVLTTPLDAGGTLRLKDVAPRDRMAELEFLFPVAAGAPPLAGGAAPPRGFLKGFIDLVFTHAGRWYVLDWKSNWLGDTPEDYAAPRLAAAMRESLYDLQYRLYTVALHRHLAARLPGYDYERHFGGVYYLFVRGMNPSRGAATGVFFDRPARADVDALSAALSRTAGAALQ
jgi:exodeoxyribonuclease V beta subunit